MPKDDRKDQETEFPTSTDEKITDLSSKKLNRAEEEKVKGGVSFRPTMLD
jgi:hypothetical protein